MGLLNLGYLFRKFLFIISLTIFFLVSFHLSGIPHSGDSGFLWSYHFIFNFWSFFLLSGRVRSLLYVPILLLFFLWFTIALIFKYFMFVRASHSCFMDIVLKYPWKSFFLTFSSRKILLPPSFYLSFSQFHGFPEYWWSLIFWKNIYNWGLFIHPWGLLQPSTYVPELLQRKELQYSPKSISGGEDLMTPAEHAPFYQRCSFQALTSLFAVLCTYLVSQDGVPSSTMTNFLVILSCAG